MDRVIHNDFPIGTHRGQLFDASSETAADTGCHDD